MIRALVWSEASVLGTMTWVLAVKLFDDGDCVCSMLGSDVHGLLGNTLRAGSYVNLNAAAFTGRQAIEPIGTVH